MTITRYIPASAVASLLVRVYGNDRAGDTLRPRLMLDRKDAEALDPEGKAAEVEISIRQPGVEVPMK